MNKTKAELLAPAGSYDCLRAAINAGCDAVYIGGSFFGARAYAENLNTDDLKKAIDYVHLHDKKIYLTINTLLKNNEIENDLYNYLNPFYKQGLDAVIVQDMGVFKFIREYFPEINIHASTQMTITGVDGARKLKELGATRIVTARELSLSELETIHNEVDIEIESFIHGALCYGYSGQCLLSSILGGRSGNRGRCAQPCRLPYDVTLSNGVKNNDTQKYVLSPKDMCTIDILPEIIKAGVFSLKVEGRMKSPEYVAGVMEIYRKYLDIALSNSANNYKVSKKDYSKLTTLYSRNGFSTGYYNCHNSKDMISLSSASYNSVSQERIDTLKEKYVTKEKKISIIGYANIKSNNNISLTVSAGDRYVTAQGDIPDISINRPAKEDDIRKQLLKLGDTPFEMEELHIELDDNLFIPNKALNTLRRDAIALLYEEMLGQYRRENDTAFSKSDNSSFGEKAENRKITCSVDTYEQFCAVNSIQEVDSLYINSDLMNEELLLKCIEHGHLENKKIYMVMPFIFREKARKIFNNLTPKLIEKGIDGFVVNNIDELSYIQQYNTEIIGNYSLYTMNDIAKSAYSELNVSKHTIPLELNKHEIHSRENSNDELIVYGHYPLMISAGCIKKTLNNCNTQSELYSIRDRYNKIFKIRNVCKYCYNVLYNCQPTSLLELIDFNMNISDFRLNFTIEEPKDIEKIVNKFIDKIKHNKNPKDIDNYTRGHYKRGVE